MKPRWVYELPDPEEEIIGMAIVSSWCPGKFRMLLTCKRDDELYEIWKTEDSTQFYSQIVKCDKYGKSKGGNQPLFEREYLTLEEAKEGHAEAVKLIKEGRFKLSPRS